MESKKAFLTKSKKSVKIFFMPKYKKYVEEMIKSHQDLFNEFKILHDNYALDPKAWQNEFNQKGQEIMTLIQRWENSLLSKTESGKYGKFSTRLSDKFWEEIRTIYPKINYIGLQLKQKE